MTADQIAHCLARNLFASDLVVLDRCSWPGSECDVLVLTKRLQVIDVEIKISKADLKADRDKAKWYDFGPWVWDDERKTGASSKTPRAWPRRVWKHYYAMPATLWKPELAELCHHASGIITIDNTGGYPEGSRARERRELGSPKHWRHEVVKRATPCPDYDIVSAADVQALARLASLRMWDAYHDYETLRRDRERMTQPKRPPDTVELLEQFIRAWGALPAKLREAMAVDRFLERAIARARQIQEGAAAVERIAPVPLPDFAGAMGGKVNLGRAPVVLENGAELYVPVKLPTSKTPAAVVPAEKFSMEPSPERARRKRKKIRGSA